jgi:hypothetical protein
MPESVAATKALRTRVFALLWRIAAAAPPAKFDALLSGSQPLSDAIVSI